LRSTCPTFLDWVTLITGVGGAGQTELLLRVAYPEPTPVTIMAQLAIDQFAPVKQAMAPKLFGFPADPPAVVLPTYQAPVGTLIVEWLVAGAQFSALLDLGAQSLSIPACDQVSISYAAHLAVVPFARLSVVALPVWMPGTVGTLTRTPAVVPAGSAVGFRGRSSWARRWKLTAAEQPLFPVPGPIGTMAVRIYDIGTGGDSAEIVNFVDFTATAGIIAMNQGWIETGGFTASYEVINLGAADVKCKIIEQIQVA